MSDLEPRDALAIWFGMGVLSVLLVVLAVCLRDIFRSKP